MAATSRNTTARPIGRAISRRHADIVTCRECGTLRWRTDPCQQCAANNARIVLLAKNARKDAANSRAIAVALASGDAWVTDTGSVWY